MVWLRLGAELRAKWRVTAVLAVLLGLGGGVALTALAGAHRSDSAMGQFVAYSLPDDGGFLYGNVGQPVVVPGQPRDSLALAPVERRIVELPQVAAYFRSPYLFVTTGRSASAPHTLNVVGEADASLFRTVDRPLVTAGHLPSPTRPFEAVVNEFAAAQRHLHVGSRVTLRAYTVAQSAGLTGSVESAPVAPGGPTFTVRVAAIIRPTQTVNAVLPLATRSGVSYEGQQYLYVTPAFLVRLARGLHIPAGQLSDLNLVGVRLRHGASDWRAFSAAARRIGGAQVFTSPGNVFAVHLAARSAQHGIHLEVVALLLFGGLAALVTLLLIGQATARQVLLEADDYRRLRVLGASSRQLLGIVASRAGAVGLGGAVLAFAIAVLASPLMPLGLARQAEIHPGISIDPTILVPGALALGALVAGWSLITGWRAIRAGAPAWERPSWVGALLARRPVAPVFSIGTRFGLERGRGAGSVPVLSAIAAATIAIGTLSASFAFASSLHRLETSPRQQGWNWDVLVGNPNDLTDRTAQVSKILEHNPRVGGFSAIAILGGADQGSALIDHQDVDLLLAFDNIKGSVDPPLLAGHQPRSEHQIVLASQSLTDLHKAIGDSVHLVTPGGVLTLRIVGEMVSPSVGDLFTNSVGQGAWVYGPAVRKVVATAERQGPTPPTVFNMFAVRFAPGVSAAAGYASLRREFGPTVLRQLPSEDVVNLESVDRLPFVLSGLVVLLGIATLVNTLVNSVRRRRRDLAILKTIGFTRRQCRLVVVWQASTFCLVSLAVGVPLGVIAGGAAWRLVASGIGSVSPTVVPAVAIALVVPATLAIGNAVAAIPGWLAARVGPATVLRTA